MSRGWKTFVDMADSQRIFVGLLNLFDLILTKIRVQLKYYRIKYNIKNTTII